MINIYSPERMCSSKTNKSDTAGEVDKRSIAKFGRTLILSANIPQHVLLNWKNTHKPYTYIYISTAVYRQCIFRGVEMVANGRGCLSKRLILYIYLGRLSARFLTNYTKQTFNIPVSM